ncbi:MAG: DUF4214 domain-containing protein, partial [Pseudomonadota bacterium]
DYFTSRFDHHLTDNQFIDQLYQNTFNADANEAGMSYWSGILASGRYDRYDAATLFSESAGVRNLVSQELSDGLFIA